MLEYPVFVLVGRDFRVCFACFMQIGGLRCSYSVGEKSQLLELERAYKANFVSFMVTQQALSDQVDDLGQIYDRIRRAIAKIMSVADAQAQVMEIRAEKNRQKLVWLIGLATLLAGLFRVLSSGSALPKPSRA
ncbi:hypothetical protein [Bradyrhizobium sp. BR 1432]|uniref:hypothetical protein n=1 Tax=Bradyrhizobium sp. BR 1432 TaxID=3447966 RepID=UPI003EE66164